MMTSPNRWQSVHVFYYDEHKDDLILNAVRPLMSDMSGKIDRAFFVRHWLRGPHLRLRFEATDAQLVGVVPPLIEQHIAGYLHAHPSTTTLDEQALRPIYERLAEEEAEEGPVLPLYLDNSIHYMNYDRRLHVLHHPVLAEIIEDFYTDTNDLVFAMLEAVRARQS